MEEALVAICSGMSIRQAMAECKVKESTLGDRFNGVSEKRGPPRKYNDLEEKCWWTYYCDVPKSEFPWLSVRYWKFFIKWLLSKVWKRAADNGPFIGCLTAFWYKPRVAVDWLVDWFSLQAFYCWLIYLFIATDYWFLLNFQTWIKGPLATTGIRNSWNRILSSVSLLRKYPAGRNQQLK